MFYQPSSKVVEQVRIFKLFTIFKGRWFNWWCGFFVKRQNLYSSCVQIQLWLKQINI